MARSARLSAVAIAFTIGLAVAPQAGALSCLAHPDGSPASIVAGTEQLSTGERFFDVYDLAIIGTPVGTGTVVNPMTGREHVTTTFRLEAAFGVSEIEETITVTTGDPLLAAGVSFDPQQIWFMGLKAKTSAGLTNFVFPCDPITAVEEAEVPLLIAGAAPGIPVAVPGNPPPPPPPPPEPPSEGAMPALSKTAPSERRAGGLITYRLTVTNLGGANGNRITLTDRLPVGLLPIRRSVTHPKVRVPWARYRAALKRYRSASSDARRPAYRAMIARRAQMRRARFGSAYLPKVRGRVVSYRVGRVRPGASKTVLATFRIAPGVSGAIENQAVARAANGAVSRASVRTVVTKG